jgi:hypothetical protein
LVVVAGLAASQNCQASEVRFTRRDVRERLHQGDTQMKIHLARLLEMEYLLLHRRGLTYEYALLWDGGDGEEAHLCGLLDVAGADAVVTDNEGGAFRSGSEADRSDTGREAVGYWPGGGRRPVGQPKSGVGPDGRRLTG